jgi:hypothetical protein
MDQEGVVDVLLDDVGAFLAVSSPTCGADQAPDFVYVLGDAYANTSVRVFTWFYNPRI